MVIGDAEKERARGRGRERDGARWKSRIEGQRVDEMERQEERWSGMDKRWLRGELAA